MCTSLVCATDAAILLHHVRKTGSAKLKKNGFQPSTKDADVANSEIPSLHFVYEKHHELMFAQNLCRFVLITVAVSFCVNHLPYAIMEFMQVVHTTKGETIELVVLWLVLIEALLSPHLLWLFSKRYRHAVHYAWKVYILRDKSAIEIDPASCTLQVYTRRVQDCHGNSLRITRRLRTTEIMTITTDQGIQATETDVDTVVAGMVQIHNNIGHQKQNGILYLGGAEGYIHEEPSLRFNMERTTPAKSSASTPIKKPVTTPVRDLHRTSSGHSRTEWKEQMRKKHLPPIFVNEAFDSEEPANKSVPPDRAQMYHNPEQMGSMNSMHYYMSSDYHPDYLTDSLSRERQRQAESDSEGIEGIYEEKDIANILDTYPREEASENSVYELEIMTQVQKRTPLSGFPYGESDSNEDQTEMENLATPNDDEETIDSEGSLHSPTSAEPVIKQSVPQHISNGTGFVESEGLETPVFRHATNNTYIFVDNESETSDNSITFKPLREERMRPVWMDEMENDSNEDIPILTEVQSTHNVDGKDSDEHTINSINKRLDERSSEGSTPVSVVFDEEIDRGFEEALAFGNATSSYSYSGVGLCFESIKEEPEVSPKKHTDAFKRVDSSDVFETKAIMQRSNADDSNNENENPFDNVPIRSPLVKNKINAGVRTLRSADYMLREEEEKELVDSGFTSGADNSVNNYVLPSYPWPEMPAEVREEADNSFESDFSSLTFDENVQNDVDSISNTAKNRKSGKTHPVVVHPIVGKDFHFSLTEEHIDVKSAYF
ncbi:hypothetical protein ScPMuIL_009537 [Solemya velum]